jgi:hypothetical protein
VVPINREFVKRELLLADKNGVTFPEAGFLACGEEPKVSYESLGVLSDSEP